MPPTDPTTDDASLASAALTEAPILAYAVRGGFRESAHRASAVALDREGTRLLALGGIDAPVFPRSANKPIQALGMVRSGLDLPAHLLALACASHSGEPLHLEGVRAILAGARVAESELQNTPDYPLDETERDRIAGAGLPRTSIYQNCSGKHAAMLATCVAAGWDRETYRDPGHPLQQAIAQTLSELTGEPIAALAPDGCGAPVMAISLSGLARAFGRLAAAEPGTAEAKIADAMRAHPEYVGGTGRDVTAVMRGTPGAIAKDGAEAVYAVGLPDGRGIALKVADGAQRARPVILAAVLAKLGVESAAYEKLRDAPLFGHGEPVGGIVAVEL
ncbi:MAG: asparaginase [Tetrasphaera sp.]